MSESTFGKNFIWGAATAAYQIEGAAYADGKGLSVWDMMTRWEGKVYNGDTGDVACDHYNRMEEDVAIMKSLGLKAYRFSISWPRVIPNGDGAVNEAGLDFYDRLVNALLAADIEPYCTLFHWDYPYELFCRGGWLNRRSPEWFAEYTKVIVNRLGDRVKNWMTLNEPQVFLGHGHRIGEHAPGMKYDWPEFLRATHHTLMAHGRAVQELRAHSGSSASIGYAPVGVVKMPAHNSPSLVEKVRKEMFDIRVPEVWTNAWMMDPVVFGHYPEDGLRVFGKMLPELCHDDLDTICQPLDFLGVNIYNGQILDEDNEGNLIRVGNEPGHSLTKFNWPITPSALYWGPKFLQERYKLPIIITENGLSSMDWKQLDGSVQDLSRIDFLTRYLQELKKAIRDGVDVRGYFQWSLMDNFEWASGYAERFGLVYVDYQTGERTLKSSAHWYKKLIENNGASI